MVASCFAVAAMFNMGMLNENSAGDVSQDAIAVMAEANPEYPHYGNYGTDTWNCPKSVSVTGTGTVCYKGICVDYDGETTVEWECDNCAWDCNTDGANNTCDHESC